MVRRRIEGMPVVKRAFPEEALTEREAVKNSSRDQWIQEM